MMQKCNISYKNYNTAHLGGEEDSPLPPSGSARVLVYNGKERSVGKKMNTRYNIVGVLDGDTEFAQWSWMKAANRCICTLHLAH